MKRCLAIALWVLAVEPAASEEAKPSFDCAKAHSQAEKRICSDEGLARLDRELADAYQAALREGTVDKPSQLTWMRSRDAQCASPEAKECMRTRMQQRIFELRGSETRLEISASYSDHAKSTLLRLLQGRDFKPNVGCRANVAREDPQFCAALLDKLRTGDFEIIAPDERSTRPDMPSYLRARKKCRKLDPIHIEAHAGAMTTPGLATRNFAMYRLRIADAGPDEVLVFRAQHYVMGLGNTIVKDDNGNTIRVWPGQFVAFGFPSCRELANAIAEEGEWTAPENDVREDEWLSELMKISGEYFVVNITPIAEPKQERDRWYYWLELWDWGAHADAIGVTSTPSRTNRLARTRQSEPLNHRARPCSGSATHVSVANKQALLARKPPCA